MNNPAVDVSTMMTTDDAADRLGISRAAVLRFINGGWIDSVQVKRRWYISQEALDDFIKRKDAGMKMPVSGGGSGTYQKDKNPNDEDPWMNFAAAIVKTGISDYRTALRKKNWYLIRFFEEWLRSQYVEFLTMGLMDPSYVIKRERQKYL